MKVPYSYESSIGVQRQLSATMALQADYVVNNSRRELFQRNINLTYNPATGVNYVSTDASRAVYADWGVVNAYLSEGWSNFHALEMAFTKRLSSRWQASGTYTLSVYRDGTTSPAPSITLVQDLGEEYGLATTDQRHRAVFNGIWDVGYGFQLSGLYFYGSGQRFATTYGGGDRTRLRADGSIVPRNNFVGLPLHRVDFRLLRRFGLGRRRSIDGIAEAYNLFNHANWLVHARGKQCELRQADPERRPRLPAADGAARIPNRLLTSGSFGRMLVQLNSESSRRAAFVLFLEDSRPTPKPFCATRGISSIVSRRSRDCVSVEPFASCPNVTGPWRRPTSRIGF
jgi:hypothetical protein